MNLLIGAATVGLILAPLALGVFISYRIYRTLDLTADGSFGVGAALTAALLVQHAPPIAATALGAVAGAVAGAITGLLHTRLLVNALLAGVLTSTALYSVNLFLMGGGNLSLAATDSIVTVAERVGTRLLGLPAEVTLWGTPVGGGRIAELLLMALLAAYWRSASRSSSAPIWDWRCARPGAIPRWPGRPASTWTEWSCSASASPTG